MGRYYGGYLSKRSLFDGYVVSFRYQLNYFIDYQEEFPVFSHVYCIGLAPFVLLGNAFSWTPPVYLGKSFWRLVGTYPSRSIIPLVFISNKDDHTFFSLGIDWNLVFVLWLGSISLSISFFFIPLLWILCYTSSSSRPRILPLAYSN